MQRVSSAAVRREVIYRFPYYSHTGVELHPSHTVKTSVLIRDRDLSLDMEIRATYSQENRIYAETTFLSR